MFGKRTPGIHVPGHKNTISCKPEMIPVPATVTIPMSMHIGAPCTPVVKMGDEVKVGQLIGEAGQGLGVPIHSSVSGKVTAMTEVLMANGRAVPAITITTDGAQTVAEGLTPPTVTNLDEFVAALKASGLVGLGGAGFPAWMKVSSSKGAVDTLLINGSECEPYCTTNVRTMIDDAADVIEGARQVAKYLDVKHIVISTEDEMKEAVAALEKAIGGDTMFEIKMEPTRYPAGAEKVIIYNVLGRTVPQGGLPKDAQVIIMNATSLAFVAQYMRTGMPLTQKAVTVDGSAVKKPGIVIAPVGTSIQDLLDACGGLDGEAGKIINGGPMMGPAVPDTTMPLMKQNGVVLALKDNDARIAPATSCIHCGRCANHCPMGLMPPNIEKAYLMDNVDGLIAAKADLCMECGVCSFVCPAKKDVVQMNRLAKPIAMAAIAAAKKAKAAELEKKEGAKA
ncbi:MAG: RnfABCDGE type electron transport complex subunit C [Oscillospiraceae bacterium]